MNPGSRRPRLRTAPLLATAILAAALAAYASGATTVLEHLAPALLAFLLLASGHYPGERALLRLSRATPRVAPGAPRIFKGQRSRGMPRGGLLLAAALASRAPPPSLMPL